jgi:hypothetical protein
MLPLDKLLQIPLFKNDCKTSRLLRQDRTGRTSLPPTARIQSAIGRPSWNWNLLSSKPSMASQCNSTKWAESVRTRNPWSISYHTWSRQHTQSYAFYCYSWAAKPGRTTPPILPRASPALLCIISSNHSCPSTWQSPTPCGT